MILVDSKETTNNNGTAYLYYLVAPASGTHNVVMTLSAAEFLGVTAVSYAGVNQAIPIDVRGTATAFDSSGTYSQSVTTQTSNDWVLMMSAFDGGGSGSPGSGSTLRGTILDDAGRLLVDSNGPINPPGSTSLNISHTGSIHFASVMAGFKSY
jgi:hypothetical protein